MFVLEFSGLHNYHGNYKERLRPYSHSICLWKGCFYPHMDAQVFLVSLCKLFHWCQLGHSCHSLSDIHEGAWPPNTHCLFRAVHPHACQLGISACTHAAATSQLTSMGLHAHGCTSFSYKHSPVVHPVWMRPSSPLGLWKPISRKNKHSPLSFGCPHMAKDKYPFMSKVPEKVLLLTLYALAVDSLLTSLSPMQSFGHSVVLDDVGGSATTGA